MNEISIKSAILRLKNKVKLVEYNFCEIKEMPINTMIPLTQYLVEERYHNAKKLLSKYEEYQITLFSPVTIGTEKESKTILPPIIEKREKLWNCQPNCVKNCRSCRKGKKRNFLNL